MGHEGPHHRQEAAQEDGLPAPAVHERLGTLPDGGGQAAAESSLTHAGAERAAGPVGEEVPRQHRGRGDRDQHGQVQPTGPRQSAGREQQRQSGDERPDEQDRFGEDRQHHDGVRTRGRLLQHPVHPMAAASRRGVGAVAAGTGRRSCRTLAGGRLVHTVRQPVA